MKKSVPCGVFIIALCASLPAQGATAQKPRPSFFNATQSRADVPVHLKRIFAALDLNHDGFVTRDEIETSQATFDERMAKGAPKRAARMFARLDTNHDGSLTLSDYEARRKSTSSGKRRSTPALIKQADANSDGTVTKSEFDAAAASGKLKLRHANMRGSAIVRLFDTADANKDGRLSFEEAEQASIARFDAADADHDGTLTPVERRQASKAARIARGS